MNIELSFFSSPKVNHRSSSKTWCGITSKSSTSLFIESKKWLSSKTLVRFLSRSLLRKVSKYSRAHSWTWSWRHCSSSKRRLWCPSWHFATRVSNESDSEIIPIGITFTCIQFWRRLLENGMHNFFWDFPSEYLRQKLWVQ